MILAGSLPFFYEEVYIYRVFQYLFLGKGHGYSKEQGLDV